MASQATRAERLLGQEEPLKIKAENVYNEGGGGLNPEQDQGIMLTG